MVLWLVFKAFVVRLVCRQYRARKGLFRLPPFLYRAFSQLLSRAVYGQASFEPHALFLRHSEGLPQAWRCVSSSSQCSSSATICYF